VAATVRVFLVHGMGRSPLAMAWLARRLRAAGHTCDSFGYGVRRESLERIGARCVRHVRRAVQRDGGGPYAVVGHSPGGIMTRMRRRVCPALDAARCPRVTRSS
jgi:thioesterase domain-containing protein